VQLLLLRRGLPARLEQLLGKLLQRHL